MRMGPIGKTALADGLPEVAGIIRGRVVDEVEIKPGDKPGEAVFDMEGWDGEEWHVVPAAGHKIVALRFVSARTVGEAYLEAAEGQPLPEPRYVVRVNVDEDTTTATVFVVASGAFAQWLGAAQDAARNELNRLLAEET